MLPKKQDFYLSTTATARESKLRTVIRPKTDFSKLKYWPLRRTAKPLPISRARMNPIDNTPPDTATEDGEPCRACKNLDLKHKTPAYRPLDFHTFLCLVCEAADASCPICVVLVTAAVHFAADASFFGAWCKIDIGLPIRPDRPLSLSCWEDGGVNIELFAVSELPAPFHHFRPTPLVSKSSDAPECFHLIQKWIAECDADHEDCRLLESPPLPTRVIDVNPTAAGLRPVLLEAGGRSGRYAALSYSWGTSLPLKLTRSSVEAFKSGLPWSAIPKTLRHAMAITHRLGLRYIWIDALNIIQDDEEDWEVEATKMAGIYGNAFITIAATLSSDCQHGIFAPRSDTAKHHLVWPLGKGEKPYEVQSLQAGAIYARNGWKGSLSSNPLWKRGWSLQEHILSRRIIQYAAGQLVWHCRTGIATESAPKLIPLPRHPQENMYELTPAFLPRREDIDHETVDSLSRLWTDIVTEYSQRNLTRETDKLYAISGVAQALQSSGMGPSFSGIFASDLLGGLTWYSKSHFPEGTWEPTHIRPKDFKAPSWSWASVSGEVGWLSAVKKSERFHARCQVVHISDAELVLRGKVIDGMLLKHSACLPITSEGTGTRRGYSSGFSELALGDHIDKSTWTDIIDTTPMHPGIDPPHGLRDLPLDVICFLLGDSEPSEWRHSATALVLTPSSVMSGAYERVGINSSLDFALFAEAKERQVRII